jgi:group I intron endonuclease
MIIYKAQNKINGKVYVGMTAFSLRRRMAFHLRAKTGIFPAALRKYGRSNFEIEPIAWCDNKEQLVFLEKFYIDFFKCKVPRGYNITDGGNGGMLGYKASEETRRKQSESSQGKNKGEKNGMFGKPGIMRGKRHREESKIKDSESKKKNWKDPEYRRKIAEARKSSRYSESMSAARRHLWKDPNYRARQIEARRKIWNDPEYRARQILNLKKALEKRWRERSLNI